MQVLVAGDDGDHAAALARLFAASGFDADCVPPGADVVAHVERYGSDLVILDLGAPDTDGLEVCRQLRAAGFEGGLIVVSGRGEELDVVAGLDAGADDYLVKPCSIAELQSRVRSVLRRIHGAYGPPTDGPLREGPRLEVLDHHIAFGGVEVATHGREFDVLALLIAARGRLVPRQTLMDSVWGPDWDGSSMVLSSAIGRIRARLAAAHAPEQVENVHGVGFRLAPT